MDSQQRIFSDFSFKDRHIGPRETEVMTMLQTLGCNSMEEFVQKAVPEGIRTQKPFLLPDALAEHECLNLLKNYARQNHIFKSYIGMGYYETRIPAVIQRNILENPVWLTPYTPYQSEIAQGRLQALLNFQTMITELTELEVANSSLLDEGTACAEAISMAYNNRSDPSANHVFIDRFIFPQTRSVLQTRAKSFGLKIITGNAFEFDFDKKFFCVVIQYPASNGCVYDWTDFCREAHKKSIMTVFSADPLSLCLLKTPGSMGADIVTGSCHRLGLPMMFGGPHAAYLATKNKYVRSIPGRIVGVSKDRHGHSALRLALQTREQHIRRERATSNICTAQALPAVLAGMFAVYQGPKRLRQIAQRIHLLAISLAKSLQHLHLKIKHTEIFDTVQVEMTEEQQKFIYRNLVRNKINAALISKNTLSFSVNETTTVEDIKQIVSIFCSSLNLKNKDFSLHDIREKNKMTHFVDSSPLPSHLIRKSDCLKHPVFYMYHSETALLRYIHHLQNQDLSLTHSMISLGSCTMKLNGTTELMPISWPGFSDIHPFAPLSQTKGYQKMIGDLESYLCDITGFDAVSFQPNAGSQGEYTGLLIIRRYHEEQNESDRNICLIPASAHGTNPASAVMAGLKVVTVLCEADGSVSHRDVKEKIEKYKNRLAAMMITYPSTSGVFEEHVSDICKWVHEAGGLVYLDGANMNALVGITRLSEIGADLCHLNLHKTFCIPHGGGGPGMGPVAVTQKLKHLLPKHPVLSDVQEFTVSSAPWGSAGILMVSLAYIRLMGPEGLKKATQMALLNANYMANQLKNHYKILYKGRNNMVAHEYILDFRKFKNTAEVTVDDVAKRLIDYGFHAPTISWPVPGTMMAEPTESEDKKEMDRFCSALMQIRKEIKEVEDRKYTIKNNVLKNAPHIFEDAVGEKWHFPYSREKAFYPLPFVKEHKFWPPVSRIENAYGDMNLFCSCPPLQFPQE